MFCTWEPLVSMTNGWWWPRTRCSSNCNVLEEKWSTTYQKRRIQFSVWFIHKAVSTLTSPWRHLSNFKFLSYSTAGSFFAGNLKSVYHHHYHYQGIFSKCVGFKDIFCHRIFPSKISHWNFSTKRFEPKFSQWLFHPNSFKLRSSLLAWLMINSNSVILKFQKADWFDLIIKL